MADDVGKKAADDIVKTALEQFEQSQAGSEENRTNYEADTRFARMGDQWPEDVAATRKLESRPMHVVNKLPAFIRAIVNESRQNKPMIKVSPVDNGADEDHAEVIGGLVRSIERNSRAEIAYDTAVDHAVTGGFGFFQIEIDYAHELSFDMEARIKRIPNPLMVHWDTNSTQYDSSDWEYAFISEHIADAVFEKRWPDAAKVDFQGDDRDSSVTGHWITEDTTRVASYFLRTIEKYPLHQLAIPNQQTGEFDVVAVRNEDLLPMAREHFQLGELDIPSQSDDAAVNAWMEAAGIEHRQTRQAERFRVKRRMISGIEVLDTDEWPGSYIPICPVWGDEIFIGGKRVFRGLIADAKEPAMMLNFWRSAETELVALAPRAPFLGPKGFVPKGDEQKWDTANTRNHPYLEYEGKSGPPQRQEFAGVPAGVLQAAANNVDDMKSIMGIFDSSLGARSNEVSGKAIMARERQGDVSNFHFIDNLNRAIQWGGQILVDIIPSVYSARQSVRILGEDQKANVINLTQDAGGMAERPGKERLYNLSIGKYDVEVKTGPSFTTAREETRETLIEIMRQVPDAAPFVGDVLLDHMDFVGADKVAKRLKALLPPEVRDAEEAAEKSDDPEKAALQQELQAQKQLMQQAQQSVMQEIEKIQAENEALKANRAADAKRAETEEKKAHGAFENEKRKIEQKDRQLEQDERRLKMDEDKFSVAEPDPTVQETWDYDRDMAKDKHAFEAEQNRLDRQADLAKAIVAKASGDGIEVDDETMAEALHEAAEMVGRPAAERRLSYETRASDVLERVLETIGADRELVRDDQGNAVGSRIVRQIH